MSATEPELPPLPLATRIRELMSAAGAPATDQALRAADAARELLRWLVTAEAAEDEWARVADVLEALRAGLRAPAAASRYAREAASVGAIAARSGFAPNVRSTHPLIGRANPLAPPIELRAEGERALGDVRFGPAHEGIPRCVHGGYIAAGFDIVLGQAASTARRHGGVTGTLTVRYTALTPLGVPLRYEGWAERTEGRKTFVRGVLRTADAGGEPLTCAEAEAIFIGTGTRSARG